MELGKPKQGTTMETKVRVHERTCSQCLAPLKNSRRSVGVL